MATKIAVARIVMMAICLEIFAVQCWSQAKKNSEVKSTPPLTASVQPQRDKQSQAIIDAAIVESFQSSHDGWSSDEVILQSELNRQFVEACQKSLKAVEADAAELNWRLLNLRKAGKLKIKATRRDRRSYSQLKHIAEIAARMMEDKHSVSSDRVMADPALRKEFDQIALNIDKGLDTYLVRKAAFKLRKTRKLKPELITRVADWDREVTEHKAEELVTNAKLVSTNPGIYIFRDETGYLYIGEADNLRNRLKTHLDESDRQSLAKYLKENGVESITVEIHSFDPNSRAKELMVRRAYESELIRSRKPRFNIRP